MRFFEKLTALIVLLQSVPRALENLTSAIRAAAERIANREAAEQRHADQKKQYHVQCWIAWGTWGAFIAASVYAWITYNQWKEAQKLTVNTTRAWLGYQRDNDTNLPIYIDRVEVVPKLAVQVHYTIENFGNGPAVKVMPMFFVETDTKLVMVRRTAAFICDASVHFATGTVPLGPGLENPGSMGFILFPHQTYSASEPWAGNDPMPNLKWMNVMGCVAYVDQFKHPHWTRFSVLIGDGVNQISNASPKKLYTLFNDTDETDEPEKIARHWRPWPKFTESW